MEMVTTSPRIRTNECQTVRRVSWKSRLRRVERLHTYPFFSSLYVFLKAEGIAEARVVMNLKSYASNQRLTSHIGVFV